MLQTTVAIIKKVLEADPSVTPTERQRLVFEMRNQGKNKSALTEPKTTSESRILRRAEVARRLSVTMRSIDNLHKARIIHGIRLPGRKRCWGFSSVEIDKLIEGRCQDDVPFAANASISAIS